MLWVEAGTADPSISAVSVHGIMRLIRRILYSLHMYLGMSAMRYSVLRTLLPPVFLLSTLSVHGHSGNFHEKEAKVKMKKKKISHLSIHFASNG
jgi:hypothetical protein